MAKDLKALIREITKEVIDEMTTSGAVAGYNTPNAFGKNPNKKRAAARSMPGGTVVGETDTDETTVGENESMTIRRSLEETEGKNRTGMKCEKCHKDTYQETNQFDGTDGVLHCTECGISVSRYSHGLNEGRSRYRNFKESDLMKNHAKISYGVNQAKKMLSEVEYLLNICERLKTEANIKNSNLWKRTQPDMREIHKRLKSIASRIKNMEKK